jgi:hypothetical protein
MQNKLTTGTKAKNQASNSISQDTDLFLEQFSFGQLTDSEVISLFENMILFGEQRRYTITSNT